MEHHQDLEIPQSWPYGSPHLLLFNDGPWALSNYVLWSISKDGFHTNLKKFCQRTSTLQDLNSFKMRILLEHHKVFAKYFDWRPIILFFSLSKYNWSLTPFLAVKFINSCRLLTQNHYYTVLLRKRLIILLSSKNNYEETTSSTFSVNVVVLNARGSKVAVRYRCSPALGAATSSAILREQTFKAEKDLFTPFWRLSPESVGVSFSSTLSVLHKIHRSCQRRKSHVPLWERLVYLWAGRVLWVWWVRRGCWVKPMHQQSVL